MSASAEDGGPNSPGLTFEQSQSHGIQERASTAKATNTSHFPTGDPPGSMSVAYRTKLGQSMFEC